MSLLSTGKPAARESGFGLGITFGTLSRKLETFMLNKIATVAVIAAALGLGSVAVAETNGIAPSAGDISAMPAAGESTGTVTQVESTSRTVTLDDGLVYDLPEGYNVDLLKKGQKVHVVWEHTGGRLHVTSLELTS